MGEKGKKTGDAQKEKDTLVPSTRLFALNKEKMPVSTKDDTMTEADREKKKEGEEGGKDRQVEDKPGKKLNKT